MLADLPRTLASLDADDRVRVIVMRGAGERAFCVGADLRQTFSEIAEAATDLTERDDGGMASAQKPLIAMIHGHCIGGGLLMALGADLRIASIDANFVIPISRLGIAYPYAAVQRLVATVGPVAASEMIFTARSVGADEAHRLGFVNRVVPKEDLEATVLEVAAEIAANAPLSLRASKALIWAAIRGDEASIESARTLGAECRASADAAEGRLAFLEKRAPNFLGR